MLSTKAHPITRHEYVQAIRLRAHGVEELWIIDPAKRTLALYRLGDNRETPAATYKGKQKFASEVLPGLTIDIVEVFAS